MTPAAGAPIRVLLVDDDALVRAGLRMILSSAPDIEVQAEAGDGQAALRAIEASRPDVVLMDIRMPVLDGIATTAELAARPGSPPVIVLTTFDADEFVLRALRAGADGFLLKDTAPEKILDGVRLVHRGDAMLSPSVTRTVLAHMSNGVLDDRCAEARERLDGLTPREREVAVAIGAGASNAEVAGTLFIERGDREGTRVQAADQARRREPRPGRDRGARRRPLTRGLRGQLVWWTSCRP